MEKPTDPLPAPTFASLLSESQSKRLSKFEYGLSILDRDWLRQTLRYLVQSSFRKGYEYALQHHLQPGQQLPGGPQRPSDG